MCLIGIHGTAWQSTGVVVESDGTILAVAVGKPVHPHELSENENYTALQTLVNELLDRADRPVTAEGSFKSICIACPGVRTGREARGLRRILGAGGWTGVGHVLVDDAKPTLAAGGVTNKGIVLSVGSGSAVYGRDGKGNEWLVGGWGTPIGDESSGYEIARLAIRAILRANEGTGQSCHALTHCVMQHLDITSMDQLMGWIGVYRVGLPIRIASIVPSVVSAAEEHEDPVARSILDSTASTLVDRFSVVRDHLEVSSDELTVILEGGVIENSWYLHTGVVDRILEIDPTAEVAAARYRPVVGSALFALSGREELPEESILDQALSSVHLRSMELFHPGVLLGPANDRVRRESE